MYLIRNKQTTVISFNVNFIFPLQVQKNEILNGIEQRVLSMLRIIRNMSLNLY